MNAKVIALLNEKVWANFFQKLGKSTSATAIAYILAKQGKKTALIDFDGKLIEDKYAHIIHTLWGTEYKHPANHHRNLAKQSHHGGTSPQTGKL